MKWRWATPLAFALMLPGGVADARTITRVSVDSAGAQGNHASVGPSISADGRFVAFSGSATNLAPGDSNGFADVFVHDRQSGQTTLVSVDSTGSHGALSSVDSSISRDGRIVAFMSYANNLIPIDTNGAQDVFVHDRVTGETSRVSVGSAGAQGNYVSVRPSISANGRYVAFSSEASNLVPGDTNSFNDVFVHDRQASQTTRVSVDSSGTQATGISDYCSLSGDGSVVAFESGAPNLVPGDTNGTDDVFVHNRETGQTSRISVDSAGFQGNGSSNAPRISADGRYVAFPSFAMNLVPGGTNNSRHVFVHDRQTGQTSLMSVNSAGAQANRSSDGCSISDGGRTVAFSSFATNLVPGDTNGREDMFLHDRDVDRDGIYDEPGAFATVRVSETPSGASPNDDSFGGVLSPDARFLVFSSYASDLVLGDTNGVADVFVRERLVVDRLSPATGSESGGELVHLFGSGFGTAADTSVAFGGAAATVIDVSPDHARVRTPPGVGTVDVLVASASVHDALPGGYTYVAPHLAARYGNVNLGLGDREDVLLVNAYQGDPLRRDVLLQTGQPILIAMVNPSSRSAPSRFALYARVGEPGAGMLTSLPRGLGSMIFPPPFRGGHPAAIWNNAGFQPILGTPTLPSSPAPSLVFSRPGGAPNPIIVTLQGLIEDDGSQIPERWSVTNALIVHVRNP